MGSELVELVADRYRLASAVHGDLGVDVEEFRTHLRRISERYQGPNLPEEAQSTFVRSLHTNDLLLTLACSKGVDAAWRRFHTSYRKYLIDLSRHLMCGTPDLEELGDTIWIDLFLPDRSGQSKIASYDGRSSLATWLRVVVSHRVINERQRRSLSVGNIEAIPEPADPTALQNVEGTLHQSRYQNMILAVFKHALGKLSHREALIVLLRYDQGLQLGEIARLFDVHQSTITRQLDRVTARLRDEVMTLLASKYGLNRAQVHECLSVATDTFANSVSLLGFLKQHTEGCPTSRTGTA